MPAPDTAPPDRPPTVLAVGPADAIAVSRVVSCALERGWRVVLASDRHAAGGAGHPGLIRVELPGPSDEPAAGVGIGGDRGRAVAALRALAATWQPDIVHLHGLGPDAETCRLARLGPLVVSAWGFLNDLASEPPGPLPPEVAPVLAGAAAVLVESPPLERAVVRAFGPGLAVEQAPLGLHLGLFAPSARARARWRRALAISDDAFVVVSPRGWDPNYHQPLVFRAFQRARAACERPMVLVFLRLVREAVTGASAALMAATQATIEAEGAADGVRWLPALRHPMMAGLFAAADLLISVPASDAMPSTLIEAAACGLPFVASDLPQYRDTFIARGGTRVAPGDVAATAAAIADHARGAISVDRVALRAEIAARYDAGGCGDRLVDLYARYRAAPAPPRPAVSVIVTTHDRPRLMLHALDSALAQTVTDREIIVVDDGSPPTTAEALAPYRDRVIVVRKANGGLASARNAGLRVARGRFVAFLDDDDLWAPDRLAALLPVLEADPTADVAFADMRYIDADGAPLGGSTCFGDRPPPPGPVHPEMLFVCNVVPGGAALVRYAALADVGFLDETLRTAEDYDLWLRLSERGPGTFRRVDRVLADYRQHPGNISTTAADRLLLDVIRVREKAFDASPRIRAMHPALLDRRLFDLYLYAAGRALDVGDADGARSLLARFEARRGPSPEAAAVSARCEACG